MDTLHFDPHRFPSPQGGRLPPDHEARRIDDANLSDVEVFMLRGRRLQAQAIGGGLRHALAKLRRLLRRSRADSGSTRQRGQHRHA